MKREREQDEDMRDVDEIAVDDHISVRCRPRQASVCCHRAAVCVWAQRNSVSEGVDAQVTDRQIRVAIMKRT